MSQTYRILVVDDSPANHALIQAVFNKRTDIELVLVDSGMEAIARATDEPFDLILMDIRMPGVDGCEATQALRERGVKTPVVALTADTAESTMHRAYNAGCNDFLTRPVKLDQFMAIVDQHLKRVQYTYRPY
ncbi:MAG: response regulator [Sedimentisphaerales bacterium]|nr:response regulator [Sedimentisphaerales bacterium]